MDALTMPFQTSERAVVHVVDDDALMRGALEGLFDSVGLDTRTYAAARDFLVTGLADKPGCVVIDIRLPDMNGLEFQAQLIQMGVQLPVVMMTGYGDIPMSVRAMKAGAIDFLSKPFRDQDLLDAVTSALEQDRVRRRDLHEVVRIQGLYCGLTPRERQVMDYVVAGLMNKQIAGEIGLSEVTVKIHRSNLMRKLGVRTVAQLVHVSETLRTHPIREPI